MIRAWLLIALLCTGCSDAARNVRESHRPPAAVHKYTQVAGVVQSLPSNGTMFLEVIAIPDFVGPGGQKDSIAKLVLPFRVDEQVGSNLKVGDRILCDLEIDWDLATPGKLIAIRR